MVPSTPAATSPEQVRQTILAFLQERLQAKLDDSKNGDEVKRQKLQEDYQPHNWIPDAARRVGQIQQVTHALKFTHPDARGSSLSSTGNPMAGELEIGTHTFAADLPPDVVGNAAALDVYKFLRLDVGGSSLLERAIAGDAALATALSEDPGQAAEWMAAFASLPEPNGKPASHKLAKQLYWPVGNDHYHLLAPLFPTSLVHVMWEQIKQDRFSKEAKAAWEARREQRAHHCGYCEYPDLVVQKVGGSNQQNVSQLNSERNGQVWLLRSLPPTWKSDPVRQPLRTETVFARRFGSRYQVKELTRILRDFLVKVANVNSNEHIRDKRAELVGYIRDELFQFAAELHELDGGWSQLPDCRLNVAEQCWLDPKRAEFDEDFAALRRRGDWQDEICLRFGNWLNARISTERTPMGQAEAIRWQSVLDAELRMIRTELDFND